MGDEDGNSTRLDALVGYAVARYDEGDYEPVLVVEKRAGHPSVVSRGAWPLDVHRLTRTLEVRTRFRKWWGALVWSDRPTEYGSAHPVRYVYCTNPDHRAGLLLAQRYDASGPVGEPEPVDRHDEPIGWSLPPLSTERSPIERFRSRGILLFPFVAALVGLFFSNALVWFADRLGGTTSAGATVVHHEFDPKPRGADHEVRLVTDGGGRVELDGGDLRHVYEHTALGDHVEVLTSGFTGRTVGVRTPSAYLDVAGGWGEPVAWTLLAVALAWLLAKLLTWRTYRWWLAISTPVGVVAGLWLTLNGPG
ncbi:hypothetical protein [Pseudonocardia lacus]|uniref:hypothetical protein n=1 Tax=Pseudonocardia lacus TaxID=2835865 RepID=UPI001BDD2B1C|nr:hypothetical protein [Pseudonocardia lacus]